MSLETITPKVSYTSDNSVGYVYLSDPIEFVTLVNNVRTMIRISLTRIEVTGIYQAKKTINGVYFEIAFSDTPVGQTPKYTTQNVTLKQGPYNFNNSNTNTQPTSIVYKNITVSFSSMVLSNNRSGNTLFIDMPEINVKVDGELVKTIDIENTHVD